MPSKIADAEYEVMDVLWRKSPLTGNEVIQALSERTGWKPNTVRTLISRLVKKGVLDSRKEGKEYLYTPLKSKEECIKEEGESFLKRFFDGSLLPMLAHFVEDEKLSDAEREELKGILKRKG